jgi:hypothetical protein
MANDQIKHCVGKFCNLGLILACWMDEGPRVDSAPS